MKRSGGTGPWASWPCTNSSQNLCVLSAPPGKRHAIPTTATFDDFASLAGLLPRGRFMIADIMSSAVCVAVGMSAFHCASKLSTYCDGCMAISWVEFGETCFSCSVTLWIVRSHRILWVSISSMICSSSSLAFAALNGCPVTGENNERCSRCFSSICGTTCRTCSVP